MLSIFVSQVSIPTTISIIQLNFDSLFEEVFETQYQISWETIDTIFSDLRFKSLDHFIIWTDSIQIINFEKERLSIFQKILPKLFKKDILWWGHWSRDIGMLFSINFLKIEILTFIGIAYHVSSYGLRSLAWYQLRNLYE